LKSSKAGCFQFTISKPRLQNLQKIILTLTLGIHSSIEFTLFLFSLATTFVYLEHPFVILILLQK